MPEIDYKLLFDGTWEGIRVRCILWEGLAKGDKGKPFVLPLFNSRSVQVVGTAGIGGKVQIKGSNVPSQDDPPFDVLSDTRHGLLEFSSAGSLRQVAEVCHQLRPEVVAGDENTRFDVYLYMKSS
jgi:hypothetical protein